MRRRAKQQEITYIFFLEYEKNANESIQQIGLAQWKYILLYFEQE